MRKGITNPAIGILAYNEPRLRQLCDASEAFAGNYPQRDKYIAANYGFLGDDFEGAEFPLGSLDMIAIWSKVFEIWPYGSKTGIRNRHERYAVAQMLCSAFGIQGRQELKGLSRHLLETDHLPEGLAGDRSGLEYVKDRLTAIGNSRDDISFYVTGLRDFTEKAKKLIRRTDAAAQKEIEQLEARIKERQTPLIAEAQENIGAGCGHVYTSVTRTLGELEG